jgi:hypothetical protein
MWWSSPARRPIGQPRAQGRSWGADDAGIADGAIGSHAIEARRLSPWAGELRYGEVIDEALDRPTVVALVDDVIGWAAQRVAED